MWTGEDCMCGHPIVWEHGRSGPARCAVCACRYRREGEGFVVVAPFRHLVDALVDAEYDPRSNLVQFKAGR